MNESRNGKTGTCHTACQAVRVVQTLECSLHPITPTKQKFKNSRTCMAHAQNIFQDQTGWIKTVRPTYFTGMMWCYKIIFGLVDIDVNKFFTLSSVPHTSGHRYKLLKPNSTGIHSTFFCETFVNAWNNLSADVNFSTISTLRCSINCDFSRFLQHNFS